MLPPPPIKKKTNIPLIFGVAGAVIAVLAVVFMLFFYPLLQEEEASIDLIALSNGRTNITINAGPPGVRVADFEVGETGFTTNDQAIRMIEVNQGLSYGYDANKGEFYLIENFVAGKETAIFIDFDEPFDLTANVRLGIERNGEHVAILTSVDVVDSNTLLFHPRDMGEVDYWEPGVYTFTFIMDDSVAVRTTNFHRSIPMKVLAVPIRGNYSRDIRTCGDEWKLGSTMLTAVFPVAMEDVEFVLGPEQDFSDPSYDLNSREGRRKVWQALSALQTPNNDYSMIIGFMPTPTIQGYLGYTYGGEATIVCESGEDMLSTVVHEIAHCYNVGDEYDGGSLNTVLNPPPYGMRGHDIVSGEPSEGTKQNVLGGDTVGLRGTGSVIYPKQRAYWLEGRQVLGTKTSYMGSGTGEDSFMFWTSSDIWNHLFKAFTGQLAGNEPVYDETSGGPGSKDEHWGQCFECFGDVHTPDMYIECVDCAKMVKLSGGSPRCSDCGTFYIKAEIKDNDLWLYHVACKYLLNYSRFIEYNSSSTTGVTNEDVTVLEIRGSFDPNGIFTPEPWYSYPVSTVKHAVKLNGEYSASVFDVNGKRLSIVYFDAKDDYQIYTREGYKWGEAEEEADIPIRVTVKFPESAAKVIIHKGGREVYTKTLTANAPQVVFTGLIEGQILNNNTTFTWEASDADGDDLTFQIWYYRSEDEMHLIASDITGTSYDADLTDYPGTDQGWFRILATDGGRTGTGESPKVSVPFKAPDILNYIPDGKQFKVTDMVEIFGKVYDAQDGWLWYQGYEWYVDGVFMSSYNNNWFWRYPYMLSPGNHTITMIVTNSAGLRSRMDFNIVIIADESDLPDNWPKNEITLALRMGYYQPLHRLDSPVTRLEFSRMMFSYFTLPWDGGMPAGWTIPQEDLLCRFSDMSNDHSDLDFLLASFMVRLGLMEPRNAVYEYNREFNVTVVTGEFEPHGTLTEREAMQIMYMAHELNKANTYTTYEVLDESVFIPQHKEMGMLDEPGSFNAYTPDGRMSKGLTMVRIARYIRYTYEMEDKNYGIESGFFDNFN